MTRIRLTAPAMVDGAIREPGYEYDLPEGMRGPHTTKRISHDTIDVGNDSNRILGKLEDVPLFEIIKEA